MVGLCKMAKNSNGDEDLLETKLEEHINQLGNLQVKVRHVNKGLDSSLKDLVDNMADIEKYVKQKQSEFDKLVQHHPQMAHQPNEVTQKIPLQNRTKKNGVRSKTPIPWILGKF